ncbi:putative replication factor C subunit 2 [Cardiosporidium cionae]|uniref:Replication factor C subunit 2 n=1 Tax=Cardiosporidium cionae TaxID=476202 RepID=A0ABQ7J9I3_9APIC|nr:putative replication factor C subunit 2 [Cardiosporidium cionae]|eukprot:KAF8820657.1 putative replication factor C subunit 2 [Cardiosporidium cionae]
MASKNAPSGRPVPWMEKYRPKRVADVVHQQEVVKMLKSVISEGNMPHLLFYGPPGTGKTSAVLALAHELFGKDGVKERVLELNASDDRGISVVREKIKMYTRMNISKGKMHSETGKEMHPWKIVILDEADMMTADAQAALRRIIEAFSKSTRFVIICNYVHKIIDPLFSRCSSYRFQTISPEAQKSRLKYICSQENIEITEQVLDAILKVSQGDLRRGVTLLQSAHTLFDVVTEREIYEVAGYPPDKVISSLLHACSLSLDAVSEAVDNIVAEGWDISTILKEMVQHVAGMYISDSQKAKICFDISNKDFALIRGAGEYLQLMSLCINIYRIFKEDTS